MRGFLLLLILGLGACATSPDSRRIHVDDDTYIKSISRHTKATQGYDGFNNTIDVKLTLLNASVREVMTLRKATSFQWSDKEIQADREYSVNSMITETKVFMSFFTPESKNDNLARGDTVWRVFLDVDGNRYPGTVTKATETVSELQDLFPDHTRWATPYYVKFMVPTRKIEEASARVTLTGPVGSSEVVFSQSN